ncbi:hypothetical protein BKA70DRAFT_1443634 [Coprinopsis sp. MPI-PUGE-AT-0042]|nr:hypothetical protein BKA70DRAFT_1443634 [Coprinopsis sp. MPI-PUGE-AT-0042]
MAFVQYILPVSRQAFNAVAVTLLICEIGAWEFPKQANKVNASRPANPNTSSPSTTTTTVSALPNAQEKKAQGPVVGTTCDLPDHEPHSEHVEAIIAALDQGSGKKNHGIDIPAIEVYYSSARGIAIQCGLELNLQSVLRCRIPGYTRVPEAERRAFDRIRSIMPGDFKKTMWAVFTQGGEQHLDRFVFILELAADRGRSDHSGAIRKRIRELMLPNPEEDALKPRLTSANDWDEQGWNHMCFAALLVPAEDCEAFTGGDVNAREAYVQQIQDGAKSYTADSWPFWMYDWDQYDKNNTDIGLFKGYLGERAARTLLTGPSTGLYGDERRGDTDSISQVLGIRQPTKYILAFIFVSVQWSLSSLTRWAQQWDDFNFLEFYDNIVEMIGADEDFETDLLELRRSANKWQSP